VNRGQGQNTIALSDSYVSNGKFNPKSTCIHRTKSGIKIFLHKLKDMRCRIKTGSWRTKTPESLKFVTILEADPNDDEFSGVKSAAD